MVRRARNPGDTAMAFSEELKTLIYNARDDKCVCTVATIGPDGPNISPKSSVILLDDRHLAYWERARQKALANLRHDKRVVVSYWNWKAADDGKLPQPGLLRFYGTAELHESGPVYERIKARVHPREIEHAGGAEGIAVLIKLDRAIDIRGNSLL
jgi:hypothetical protein